jgi:undecaprenyl diphosphate synthase
LSMKVPDHIAIIMDGNRRWAERKGVPHMMGHAEGVRSVDEITEQSARMGVKAVTLYGFSTENWSRPREAVASLFGLMRTSLEKYISKVKNNNIRFNTIGRIGDLPSYLSEALEKATEDTRGNTGMVITVALNYGARQEILDAVNAAVNETGRGGAREHRITQQDLEKHLYTAALPDPDLIIRTSGEIRLSNFLLWQSAYSELYFTDTLWPDFRKPDLEKAIEEYDKRQRRFGG